MLVVKQSGPPKRSLWIPAAFFALLYLDNGQKLCTSHDGNDAATRGPQAQKDLELL